MTRIYVSPVMLALLVCSATGCGRTNAPVAVDQ